MTTAKQFWALFKFQTAINPFIWIMPLAFGVPLLLPLFVGSFWKDYHPGFTSLLSNQNMFFIGIFGAMVMAPERFQFGAANLVTTYYGSEFLLTRAIDRPVLYRAKAATLYLLILILPCNGVANSLRNPDLVVSEYAKAVQQACISQVPGSTLQHNKWDQPDRPSLIAIPRGNVLIAEWQMWVFLAATMVLQLSILVLYPFKYAKAIFWVFFLGLTLVPLFDLTSLRTNLPTVNDSLFFNFAGHQLIFWGATAFVFLASQLWCERRFASLEQ
jgi:hypothetical protein